MAIGAITRDADESVAGAALFVDNLQFAGDSSYTTGGSPFDDQVKTALGDDRDVIAVIGGDCGPNGVQYIPGDDALGLLKAFVLATGVEVGNGVNLSGDTFNVTVISK